MAKTLAEHGAFAALALNSTCAVSNSCTEEHLLAAAANHSAPLEQAFVAATAYWVLFPLAVFWSFVAILMFVSFFVNTLLQWLGLRHEHKKLDQAVWTIHGKKYNLESWADDHPGGRWAIELGRNRDCTGLVESYHVFIDRSKLEKIMARFEIKDDSSAETKSLNATGLEFNCAFHEDVKKMVREHFQGKSHKMAPRFAVINVIVGILYLWLVYRVFAGCRPAVFLAPAVGWYLMCNTMHDASHWAISHRPWVNRVGAMTGLLMFTNSTAWYIQHVVQHHIFTNDVNDVDLYHFLPFARVSRMMGHRPQFKWQATSMVVVLPTVVFRLLFTVPCDLLTDGTNVLNGSHCYEQSENVLDLVARCRVHMWLDLLVSGTFLFGTFAVHGFSEGFWRLGVIYGLASVHFFLWTQAAHLDDDCMVDVKEGDSWALRQAATSINFQPESYFWSYLAGGLNAQSIHHVIPGVASCHYPELWPKFAEVCRKHGLQLKETPHVTSFLFNFLKHAAELAVEDAVPAQAKKVD